MNKKLKFAPELAKLVLSGAKTTTWRIFDDKDIKQNDVLDFIDSSTLKMFATAKVDSVIIKPLGELDDGDLEGHEKFKDDEELLATYRKYYGSKVNQSTEVKVIKFKLI